MAVEDVTRWLREQVPGREMRHLGPGEDGVHTWEVDYLSGTSLRLGVTGEVVDDEALLAERLMEVESQGWLDEAGEEDLWLLLTSGEVAEGT